ncbi:MAG: lysozyme inhibitor LprI family protein [Saprospiraceae bacterium]
MKRSTLLIVAAMLLFSMNKIQAQNTVTDSIFISVKTQSYLKLKETADCEMAFTSIEKRICANLEFQREHQEMDSILVEMVTYYNNNGMSAQADELTAAQKNWQIERNEECERIHGTFKNAKIITEEQLILLTDMTAERRNKLVRISYEMDESNMTFGASKDK